MNLFAILSFIAFLLYLQAGIYILYRSYRRVENIIFAFLCLAFVIFAFFSTFIYNASAIKEVYFYDRLAAIGWSSFPFLMVLFFLKISNYKSQILKKIIHFVLIPSALISLIIIFFDLESLKFYYYQNHTWHFYLNTKSIRVYFFIIYLLSSVAISMCILIKWYLKAKTNREKIQSNIILFSLMIFFVASSFTNILIPILNSTILPAMAPINSILWITGVFYAMVRYHRDFLPQDIVSRHILDRINEFLIFFNTNKKIFSINKYALKNLSYTFNEVTDLPLHKIFSEPGLIEEFFYLLRQSSDVRPIQTEILKSNGYQIPILITGLEISEGHKNHFGYVLIGIDQRKELQLRREITERLNIEESLNNTKKELESLVQKNTSELSEANKKLQIEILERKQSEAQVIHDLKEKTTLISEIHHRVKNNFQIIISLINMLSNHKDIDSKGSETLKQIAERVRTISELHEDFYSSEKLSKIKFSDFLIKLTKELNLAYGQDKNVKYKYDLSDDYIDISKAIPCGIIYHELLSNALKHAFSGKKENNDTYYVPQINICFTTNMNECKLKISDNGVGICEDIDFAKSSSIGFQMVNILAKLHLRGSLVAEKSNGTKITLKYSL